MTTEAEQILIPKQLASQLLDYLKQRPWIEVQSLMQGILKAPAAKVMSDAEPKV